MDIRYTRNNNKCSQNIIYLNWSYQRTKNENPVKKNLNYLMSVLKDYTLFCLNQILIEPIYPVLKQNWNRSTTDIFSWNSLPIVNCNTKWAQSQMDVRIRGYYLGGYYRILLFVMCYNTIDDTHVELTHIEF